MLRDCEPAPGIWCAGYRPLREAARAQVGERLELLVGNL